MENNKNVKRKQGNAVRFRRSFTFLGNVIENNFKTRTSIKQNH